MGFWTKKDIEELASHTLHDSDQLHRVLGIKDLILLGIGAVVGAGLFSITGIAAAENAGPAITIAFLFAALGCLFSGLCYSEMASMIPISGSAYTYTFATLGEFMAWIVGWNLVLEYALGAAAVSISWSAYMIAFLNSLGIHIPPELSASPWQSVQLPDGSHAYGYINIPALLIVMLISWLLMMGIRESNKFNAVIVSIKLAAVFLFVCIGIFYINAENYTPFIPPNTGEFGHFGISGLFKAAGVLFFAFVGFDAVSTAAQETKDPRRAIPIGILGSLAICTLIYVVFASVLTGMVPFQELNDAAPVAVAVAKTSFRWLEDVMNIAILAGLTSVILVMLLGQSRIFYAMSKDELLPPWFSTIHPKWKTPWHSNLVLMLFVGSFGAFAPISVVGHMTSIGTLFAFFIVCLGVILLRYRMPHLPRRVKVPLFPLIPLMGMGTCLLLMVSLGPANWLRLLVWFVIGFFIYYFQRILNKKNN